MPIYRFPTDFVWGSATSSYQIEGAYDKDGKGLSIWDTFSHTSGNIKDGTTGDVACDHYHRWADDIQLMKSLNLQAYRFSIAWPRVLPTGRGQVNQAGLDFYSRLVDGLLEADIIPYITLYHWDLPQALQDEGGWHNRNTVDAFVEYADIVSRHLGDRVKYWITHNEPWVVAFLGNQIGAHAPGLQDWPVALQISHHLLLSHGMAVPVIRQNSSEADVGITLNFTLTEPANPDDPADVDAARYLDGYQNRWFLDPIYGRHYPADMVADYIEKGYLPAEGLTFVKEDDLKTIATQTDFLGVNYYSRVVINSNDTLPRNLNQDNATHQVWDLTEMDWEVYSPGLYDLLNRLYFEYKIPKIYITENGCSYSDGPDDKGRIHDVRRIGYLREHFQMAHRAIGNGVPLAGYFVWSLLDNFEWAEGYRQRFGIVWVDYETQARLPKDSALWYRQVIEKNGF